MKQESHKEQRVEYDLKISMTVCNKFSRYSLIIFAVRDFLPLFLLLTSTNWVYLIGFASKMPAKLETHKINDTAIWIQSFAIFFFFFFSMYVRCFVLFQGILLMVKSWQYVTFKLRTCANNIIDVNMWHVIWYSNNCHIQRVNNIQQHHTPTIQFGLIFFLCCDKCHFSLKI